MVLCDRMQFLISCRLVYGVGSFPKHTSYLMKWLWES